MKATMLWKRLPTLAMVVMLLYACYSVHASLLGPAAGQMELASGLDVMINDVLQTSTADVQGLAQVMLRDPFEVRRKPAEAAKSAKVEPPPEPAPDLAEFVRELRLDATFVQGQTRIAIISGRIYHRGQHLVVAGETGTGKSYSPLSVSDVQAQRVILAARGKTYDLGYPEHLGNRPATAKKKAPARGDGSITEIDPEGELAFFKQLLNSPLGRLGKGITGINGPGRKAPARGSSPGNLP